MRLSWAARWPQRSLHAAIALASAAALAVGYGLEWTLGLEPCPLCMSQRLMFFGIAAAALAAAALASPRWRLAATSACIAFALFGAAIALRQLWLQSLPADQVPACGPTLAYMIDVLPLSTLLEAMLLGDGNCAEVSWRMLGISIPGWALVGFTGLGLASAGLWGNAWLRRHQAP